MEKNLWKVQKIWSPRFSSPMHKRKALSVDWRGSSRNRTFFRCLAIENIIERLACCPGVYAQELDVIIFLFFLGLALLRFCKNRSRTRPRKKRKIITPSSCVYMHFEEESVIYIYSKFQLDTCMLDGNILLTKFPDLVPVPGVGSGFYFFPVL